MPLFDAYVMVDWSAAAVPRLGRDSIWLCHLSRGFPLRVRETHGPVAQRPEGEGPARERRRVGSGYTLAIENLATRHEARDRLLTLLRAECRAGRAVLAGFGGEDCAAEIGCAVAMNGTVPIKLMMQPTRSRCRRNGRGAPDLPLPAITAGEMIS